MRRFLHFVQYHNAAVIILAVVFGAASATFASSEQAREAVFTATKEVVSIDNTFLVAQDLERFPFNAQVVLVSEDVNAYYIDYTYTTIELIDAAWREIKKEGTMTVSRRQILGQDLGLYVARQLGEVVEFGRDVLQQVQDRELKRGATRKVVATKYSGLIGKLLNTTTKEFAGYDPVVKSPSAPPQPKQSKTAAVAGAVASGAGVDPKTAVQVNTIVSGKTQSGAGAPTIALLGNNPARIPVGASYSDWGARVTDDKDDEDIITGWLKIEGAKNLDTSIVVTKEIRFSVTDSDGNIATAIRVVEIYDPDINLYTGDTAEPNEAIAAPESETSIAPPTPAVTEEPAVEPPATTQPETTVETPAPPTPAAIEEPVVESATTTQSETPIETAADTSSGEVSEEQSVAGSAASSTSASQTTDGDISTSADSSADMDTSATSTEAEAATGDAAVEPELTAATTTESVAVEPAAATTTESVAVEPAATTTTESVAVEPIAEESVPSATATTTESAPAPAPEPESDTDGATTTPNTPE